jgi:hypothetical protein
MWPKVPVRRRESAVYIRLVNLAASGKQNVTVEAMARLCNIPVALMTLD